MHAQLGQIMNKIQKSKGLTLLFASGCKWGVMKKIKGNFTVQDWSKQELVNQISGQDGGIGLELISYHKKIKSQLTAKLHQQKKTQIDQKNILHPKTKNKPQ